MASELKNVKDFIVKYGKEVEREIKSRLLSFDKKATGKLYNSIKFEYRESVKNLEASWRMEDYGVYVDGGVKGAGIPKGFKGKKKQVVRVGRFGFKDKMPPEKPFKRWARAKGITGSLFGIRRSVWIFGIAPTNFFTIPTTRRVAQFTKGLDKAFEKDIDNELQKQLK